MNFPDQEGFRVFKKLALERIKEAKLLLEKHPSGAYYLAGYSIELGLKAYYCKQMWFPPKDTRDLYDHDPTKLLQSCGLKEQFDLDSKNDKNLAAAWGVVKDWSEVARYRIIKKKVAKSFIDAVYNKKYGVLIWIMRKI
jgi:hypothetical protein